MKLGAKLRISYVGIVLTAVSIVLMLVVDDARRALREKIGNDLETVASIEADVITEHMQAKAKKIKAMSAELAFSVGDAAVIGGYWKDLNREDPEFLEMTVVSKEGDIIFYSEENSRFSSGEPLMGLSREDISAAEKTKPGIFYVYGDKNKTLVQGIVFSPFYDENGNERGAILAKVTLDPFFKKTAPYVSHSVAGKKAFLLNTLSTMIITQDGEVQQFEPLVFMQSNSPLKDIRRQTPSGYVVYRETSGEKVIAGYASLVRAGSEEGTREWVIVSRAPQKEVFSPAIRLRNRMIILGITVVLAAWIISFFMAQGITRPIRKLVRVTDGIANGALARRADIHQDDEVGDLARSFNKMTDNLNAAIVSRDQEIIERRNAEEQLLEGIEAKNNFVNMISREFRTPLVAVKEGVEKVLHEAGDNLSDEQKRTLELARKSGESLQKLIKDIVRFHDLETASEQLHLEKNDINEVVRSVHRAMLPLVAGKREISVMVDTDNSIPELLFDRKKMELAITNIVNVSIKNTAEGSIILKTEKEGENTVKVSVEDTGRGIEESELPKLFDRFEAPGKERDKKAGGSGLGLAISKEIIKRHRGKIWAESGEDKGLLVTFILPISERRNKG
ncbi:MAG: HAMP domain-containing protein [Candidatus Omnitrophica bacterium]|nr:HAMP domain-containing protein [Candidatus Omnitrophota bacterium]